jgi:hypothetical protein
LSAHLSSFYPLLHLTRTAPRQDYPSRPYRCRHSLPHRRPQQSRPLAAFR